MENNFSEALRKRNQCYVEYMGIFSSISSGSSNFVAKYVLNEEENGDLTQIIEKGIPLPGVKYDESNICIKFSENEKYKNNYFFRGKFCLGKDFITQYNEKTIKISIQNFFNKCERNSCILFLSGHGRPGCFDLETEEGEKPLTYKEVAEMWMNRKNNEYNKYLLIIIDSCYSGSWVMENEDNFHFSNHIGIFIQASCQANEKSSDIKDKGGMLMWNFIELNIAGENSEINILKNLKDVKQKPSSVGFYFKVENIFKLKLMFNSWVDFYIPKFEEKEFSDSIYKGELKNCLREGKGILEYFDGNKYEGEFIQDLFEGKGIFYGNMGDTYEGNWKKGMKNGKGIFYYETKFRFEGEFKNDFKHGKGTMYDVENKIFMQGVWEKDKFTRGKVNYSHDEYFLGSLVNELRDGVGLYAKNGEIFKGYFKKNKKHGFGILTDDSNNITKGVWENDLVQGFAIKTFADRDVYSGEFKNGVFCGYGVYVFTTGQKYEGEYLDDECHGIGLKTNSINNEIFFGIWEKDQEVFGQFDYSNRDSYQGYLKDGSFDGLGIYKWENGAFYKGFWSENYHHGFGILKTELGDKYKGNFHYGEYNNFGIWKSATGDIYTGHFTINEFSGKGRFEWKNPYNSSENFFFYGNWKNHKKSGKGILIDELGKYTGTFVDDKKNGDGTLIYKDLQIYFGQFKDDKRHGKGEQRMLNGKSYIGEFYEDKFNGQGIYYYSSSVYYKGEFKNDKREGTGIMALVQENEKILYEGNWKNDMKNGKFKVTFNRRNIFKGIYENDKIIGKAKLKVDGEYIYEGEFNNKFKKHGQGTIKYHNGDEFIGKFDEDKINGYGDKYYASTGEIYSGNWVNDLMEGYGRLQSCNGNTIYDGFWKNGMKNGKGVYKSINTELQGIWENNELKKRIEEKDLWDDKEKEMMRTLSAINISLIEK